MKISVRDFYARSGDTVEKQVFSILDQLKTFIGRHGMELKNIISFNFFLLTENNNDYKILKETLYNCLPEQIRLNIPVAYLAQAPANGDIVSAEVYYIESMGNSILIPARISGFPYLVIRGNNGSKLVISNGIDYNTGCSITESAEKVFQVVEKILKEEGLDFSNIFRQWNYIEDITRTDIHENKSTQHYQLFNDVRSRYYSKSIFKRGYPAATGIGINAGGVIVSFFAAANEGYQMMSIENPLQRSAFEYTEEVLVGESEYQGFCKSTPKFARAKFFANSESRQIFISGTASIRDEKTIGEKDIVRQTEITIENIQNLIKAESLSSLEKTSESLPKIDFIRVYIKYASDYRVVSEICKENFPSTAGTYVVSDLCRENLLVEIEALASF